MPDRDPLAYIYGVVKTALQERKVTAATEGWVLAELRAALDAAGYEVRPKLTVERLAELAYGDRPPSGPRPVPWKPVNRREWQAWARRILTALDAAP